MSQPQIARTLDLSRELGGGSKEPVRLVVDGRVIVEIFPEGIKVPITDVEPLPDAKHPQFYFRTSGGKQQLMVLFSTGATQIVATEP